MSKPIHIFTPCWGTHFTNLFRYALGQSFRWPFNSETLKDSIWTIVTDSKQSADEIGFMALQIIPTCRLRIQIEPRILEPHAPIGALKMRCLVKSVRECLDEKMPMLMSTPDFVWSDGSIGNMVDESYSDDGQGLCISLAHMRVLPYFMARIKNNDAPGLVRTALENAHDSWKCCEIGKDPSGIYHSGLAWRYTSFSRTTISVQHQMPSPFLVNFKESDYEFFSRWKGFRPPAFGEWDHSWPTKLIDEGRIRHIGSSDIAFMAEVTEADKNLPPLGACLPPHDQFFRTEPSVKVLKQFISTFRY